MKKEEIKVVDEQVSQLEEMTVEAIAKIIEPYVPIDYQKLREQELKRKALQYIAKFKDREGVRTWFSNNKGAFVNVETTTSKDELNGVKKQLYKKYTGLVKSRKKVIRREKVLAGQISISDLYEDA